MSLLIHKCDQGTVTRDINQIKDFYELTENDIWITLYQRKMYRCHAYRDFQQVEDGTRIRKVIGSWSCNDKNGCPLAI